MGCCDSKSGPKPFFVTGPKALEDEVSSILKETIVTEHGVESFGTRFYVIKNLIEDTEVPAEHLEELACRIDSLRKKLEEIEGDERRDWRVRGYVGGGPSLALARLAGKLRWRLKRLKLKKAHKHRAL